MIGMILGAGIVWFFYYYFQTKRAVEAMRLEPPGAHEYGDKVKVISGSYAGMQGVCMGYKGNICYIGVNRGMNFIEIPHELTERVG